ncbi:MAG: hypothetical protein K8H86_03680 [Ignavibacteriaceae bacterium]|nr:hypothetical protein [Ignavibacteriaceae bacterium]
MKKIILLILFAASFITAQEFRVVKTSGTVKAQTDTKEEWSNIKTGDVLSSETVVLTSKNSSVVINAPFGNFTLKESSALALSRLKKMTLDELLLALAMEDVTNAKKNKNNGKSRSTAVYGTEIKNDDFLSQETNLGVKKLNGAVQLAEGGFIESAVIAARETFDKYPATKMFAQYRINFASLLADLKLYDEAYKDFDDITKLKLSDKEKLEVNTKLENLRKKISAKR